MGVPAINKKYVEAKIIKLDEERIKILDYIINILYGMLL